MQAYRTKKTLEQFRVIISRICIQQHFSTPIILLIAFTYQKKKTRKKNKTKNSSPFSEFVRQSELAINDRLAMIDKWWFLFISVIAANKLSGFATCGIKVSNQLASGQDCDLWNLLPIRLSDATRALFLLLNSFIRLVFIIKVKWK